FFGAFAWYLNTGKNRDAPPESPCPLGDGGLPLWLNVPIFCPPFVRATLPTGGDVLTPLCLSISLAACSSNNTFAGKRPAGFWAPGLLPVSPLPYPTLPEPMESVSSVCTLHASMFNPPTPCANTLLATVPSK